MTPSTLLELYRYCGYPKLQHYVDMLHGI